MNDAGQTLSAKTVANSEAYKTDFMNRGRCFDGEHVLNRLEILISSLIEKLIWGATQEAVAIGNQTIACENNGRVGSDEHEISL